MSSEGMAVERDEATQGGITGRRQLDEAHAFMMRGLEYTVADCGERLAPLADAASEAGVEVAFSERPHVHGLPRLFVLRERQIAGFVDAARRLNRRGWIMRVEDGYRTRTMQKDIGLMPSLFDVILRKVVWELGGRTPEPEFLFKRLLTLAAQIPKIAPHMSGSAIDVSVLDRASGEEVDRGGPYLEMSERTPMHSPFVSPQAQRNRHEITEIMRESGFVEYPLRVLALRQRRGVRGVRSSHGSANMLWRRRLRRGHRKGDTHRGAAKATELPGRDTGRNPSITKSTCVILGKRGRVQFVRSTLRAVPANWTCPFFPQLTHRLCPRKPGFSPTLIQIFTSSGFLSGRTKLAARLRTTP